MSQKFDIQVGINQIRFLHSSSPVNYSLSWFLYYLPIVEMSGHMCNGFALESTTDITTLMSACMDLKPHTCPEVFTLKLSLDRLQETRDFRPWTGELHRQ